MTSTALLDPPVTGAPWAPGSAATITKSSAAVPFPQPGGLSALLAPSRPVVPRWRLVARPAGVLTAAAVTGVVGATVIPVDRPGIGWLLAGLTFGGTLWAVDHRARRSATDDTEIPVRQDLPGVTATPVPDPTDARTTTPTSTGSSDAATTTSEDTPPTPGSGTPAAVGAAAPVTTAGAPERPITAPAASDVPWTTAAPTGATTRPVADHDPATSGATEGTGRGIDAGAAPEVPEGSPTPDGTSRADTRHRPEADSSPAAAGSGVAGRIPAWMTTRLWWAVLTLALLGVGTVRAAGWLFVLCALSACAAGSLAVLGRRTVHGIFHDLAAVPLATFGAIPWAFTGWRSSGSTGLSRARRYGTSVLVTAGLLVVFVPLLGGADATFAGLMSTLIPEIDGAAAWQWVLLFAMLGLLALGALYLLAGPPAHAVAGSRTARTWSRSEWVLPVGALVVLFAVFVGAQFVALFGGDGYVQRTAGLTYAEYARSGFWQLSVVSILTLAIIVAVLRWAAQDSPTDRRCLRALLGAAGALALVIVCSALGRMWTYQQAYGFTVARLLVEMCELWIGVLYVLVLVAIWRLRGRWLPRAAVGTGLATLVVLAALNPEGLVAERNIDRWEHGARLDSQYLSGLSPDALPALTRLPADLRAGIEADIRTRVEPDRWFEWNRSRDSAR